MNRVFNSPWLTGMVQYRVVIILVTTFILSASMVPGFFDFRTLSLSLDRAATMGLLAAGLTVVLIAGQLDLSGGSILALSGITAIGLQEHFGQWPAAFLGILVGVLAGALNGFLVVTLKINSLVATLASMVFLRALAHLITDSRPMSGLDPMFGLAVSRPIAGTFTLRTLLFVLVIILLHIWLTRTLSGRNQIAVGSNPDSAIASGVRSNRYLFGTFVFSGLMAGVAGVIQSLSVNTGSPVFGETIVLTAIAAVVIGGTRLEGGRGSALGTLGGLLTLAFLTTALEYQNVPSYVQQVVTGFILLLLILLDRIMSGRKTQNISLGNLFAKQKLGKI